MDILLADDFRRALDTGFSFLWEGIRYELTLFDIHADGQRFAGSKRDSFTLRFRSASAIPQGSYPFDNPVLGNQLIFVVPVARTEDGFEYEAAFN